MIRIAILVFAGMTFSFSAPLHPQEEESKGPEALNRLLLQARLHYTAKKYEESNAVYRKVLSILEERDGKTPRVDLMRARIHYNMGCNYALLGKPQEALAALEKAIALGFWDAGYLEKDPTLKSLHELEAFQALVLKADQALASLPFRLETPGGKPLEKKDFEGKVLLLDVWGTWCPPCRREIPHLIRLQERYRERGLRIVGITWERVDPNDETRRSVRDFIAKNRINYPCVLLDRAHRAAIPNLQAVPTAFLFGRDGRLRKRFEGYQSYETLEAAVRAALEEKSP